MCICVCAGDCIFSQTLAVLDHLKMELELQGVVNSPISVLGTNFRSSARAASTLEPSLQSPLSLLFKWWGAGVRVLESVGGMGIWESIWKLEDNLKCQFLPSNWRQSLSLLFYKIFQASWDSSVCAFLGTVKLQTLTLRAQLWCRFWGFELGSSHFQAKYSTLSHLPSPSLIFPWPILPHSDLHQPSS